MPLPGHYITADGLSAVPRVAVPALATLLSDGALTARQRTMIAALLTVLSTLDLESVSPALAVAFTECVNALAE